MSNLWRGTVETKARIASGLVLFTYVFLHFINIGLGLIDPIWMDQMQKWRQFVTRSILGTIVLYAALTVHFVLALARLAGRRSLRMPPGEMTQIILGFLIPVFLIAHLTHTRGAHELYDVNDKMGYILALLYGSFEGWKQAFLLLIVWVHGCLGLHFWLRGQAWWRAGLPALAGAGVFVPAFALGGFLVEGRRVSAAFAAPEIRPKLLEAFNFPGWDAILKLKSYADSGLAFFAAILGFVVIYFIIRTFLTRRRSVTIRYTGGPEITAAKGLTLLEMSRERGVPHASLCGGRGRCTTCRVVIEEGDDHLPAPSAAEAQSLRAVDAPANTRLACQIRPMAATKVFRVFQADGRRKQRSHASQGEERDLALLFLDMRGFTARTTGQLPYDVVFLLNRFFDAVVPGVTQNGGKVDKYLGDGFLALFETADAESSAKAALSAIEAIAQALETFNETLVREGQDTVAIGIGAHLGEVVLGEIGAAGQAPRTLIGDTVNTASRLEGVTKEHKVQAFVSAPLLVAAGHHLADSEMVALSLRGLSTPLNALPIENANGLSAQLGDKRRRSA